MSSLRILKLDKNELTRLPDELYDIKILQELTFQQNRVTFLSPKIGQLVELQKLNVASNMISKIPSEIS
jgi:Leucine-rich repeat (LRR) protein